MKLAWIPRARAPRDSNLAAHNHALCSHCARDLTQFADDDLLASHVPLDLPIDLKRAPADNPKGLANDLEVIADD